jgi:arginase
MLIDILAVPYDSGVRGVRMGRGPEHLLEAGLVDHLEACGHSVQARVLDVPTAPLTPEPRFLLDLCTTLQAEVVAARKRTAFPIVLAGSCYVSVGILAGLAQPERTGVFWFDAHGDLNTPETSASGFLDGMAISLLTGRAWRHLLAALPGRAQVPESHICLIGARDIDPLEREILQNSDIHYCPPQGGAEALAAALSFMRPDVRRGYLHLDLDVLDPTVGRANALAAPDGMTVEDATDAIGAIGRATTVDAAAVTAYDPGYDDPGSVQRAAFSLVTAIVEAAGGGPSPE